MLHTCLDQYSSVGNSHNNNSNTVKKYLVYYKQEMHSKQLHTTNVTRFALYNSLYHNILVTSENTVQFALYSAPWMLWTKPEKINARPLQNLWKGSLNKQRITKLDLCDMLGEIFLQFSKRISPWHHSPNTCHKEGSLEDSLNHSLTFVPQAGSWVGRWT